MGQIHSWAGASGDKPTSAALDRPRVFFALWPDARTAAALDEIGRAAHASQGGRRMRRDTLHLTLAFIGQVALERIPELQAIAAQAVQELEAAGVSLAFDLVLDKLAAWRHNRIVWLGARQLPPALLALSAALHRRLTEAGYALEQRPFAAHVTLLRNARCDAELPQPEALIWSNRGQQGGFVLVRSRLDQAGARYEVLSRHGESADA